MFNGHWTPYQQNLIKFVLVNSSGVEVAGLGDGFTLQVSTNTDAFANGQGTKGEIGSGWYYYLAAADEAVPGSVSVKVTHASVLQQNLEYVCVDRNINAITYPFQVLNSAAEPIVGAEVAFARQSDGSQIVWSGITNMNGYAQSHDLDPRLDPGDYYVVVVHPDYTFPIELEEVSS